MTTADEIKAVLAKTDKEANSPHIITVNLTETEVAYLLLGLGQLSIPRPVFKKMRDPFQELKAKLLLAITEEKENG